MTLKLIFLSLFSYFLVNAMYAQDKIYKKDGDVINAKVKDVGMRTITYSRFENPDGPTYTVNKRDVLRIDYQNGSNDIFDRGNNMTPDNHGRGNRRKEIYKSNIIAVSPLQLTENGIGVGVSYEKALDKNGIINFYLPLMITFNLSDDNANYNYPYNNPQQHDRDNSYLFYAMPGIKFYPTGSYGKVRYAVGPSLVIADGKQSAFRNDYGTNISYNYANSNTMYSHFMLGVMVQNSININPTPHIYLGMEMGLGATYINRLDGLEGNTRGLVQFAFKVGYRF